MQGKKAGITAAVATALIILALVTAYAAGKKSGRVEGAGATATDFRFWAESIMFADPAVKPQQYRLVRDGAVIKKPSCVSPDTPYMRLARLPDEDKTMADIEATPDGLSWVARIAQGTAKEKPLAAAILGCFINGEKEPWTKAAK